MEKPFQESIQSLNSELMGSLLHFCAQKIVGQKRAESDDLAHYQADGKYA